MKRIILAIIASLLIMSHANALQQIAGELVISVPIGGSDSVQYGLINDEEETITIRLRAEGDVADYLSFPETVDLEPNKIVYTDITANIPEGSSPGNITGFVYALQEGEPGQVKINVQMKKSVVISVSEQTLEGTVVEEETTEEVTEGAQTSPLTGLIALVSSGFGLIVIIVVLLVILFILIKIKGRR